MNLRNLVVMVDCQSAKNVGLLAPKHTIRVAYASATSNCAQLYRPKLQSLLTHLLHKVDFTAAF